MGAYYSTITTIDDGVTNAYNALRLSVQHRFSHNFTLLSVYTWSHCMQNAETMANCNSEGANTYQDPYNRDLDSGPCDSDLRQNSVTSFVYQTPGLKSGAMDALLGRWQLGGIVTAYTGFAFYPSTGVDNSRTGVGQDRPNVVANPYVQNLNTLVWISASDFSANPLGTFGDAGYNSLRGPKFFDLDATLSRVFPVRERVKLELRFEFFDLTNTRTSATP